MCGIPYFFLLVTFPNKLFQYQPCHLPFFKNCVCSSVNLSVTVTACPPQSASHHLTRKIRVFYSLFGIRRLYFHLEVMKVIAAYGVDELHGPTFYTLIPGM